MHARQRRRYRRYLREELDRAALYRALAASAREEEREVLLGLAQAEQRHAAHWAAKLPDNAHPRGPHRQGLWSRLLVALARRAGLRSVLPFLERAERTEMRSYDSDPAATRRMAADERVHARVLAGLAPGWRSRVSNTVRAGVFGVNDGLVSNLSLVMGVVGAQVDSSVVLLTGIAGMLAGALSMAAGEFISVVSQRELLLGEIRLEPADLEAVQRRDGNELDLLPEADMPAYAEAGENAAGEAAAGEHAGSGPDEFVPRSAPQWAALSSGASFVLGAAIPVVPFAITTGRLAVPVALGAAAAALFCVGATLSLVTGRSAWWSGTRQLLVGGVAATATYLIGGLVGTAVL